MYDEAKKLISESKNICIVPAQTHEPQSLAATLALFYTLREMGKNVNVISDEFPEILRFLVPPLDFISAPKNLVISIPRTSADVSQIYYEKGEESLKIHLTVDRGRVKKEDLLLYFENAKPDAVITLGIQNFRTELEHKLDSYGFLLDAPIINIDTNTDNVKFGQVNLVSKTSISETVLDIINAMGATITKEAADCLLTGLTLQYENFQNPSTTPEVFERCALLMKHGADRKNIINHLYLSPQKETSIMKETVIEA